MKKLRLRPNGWAIVGTTLLLLAFLAGPAGAVPLLFTVSVDENGNGFTTFGNVPLPGTMATDPTSGLTALTYTLPFPVTPGDVLMTEDVAPPSDLVRFNYNPDAGISTLVFYSDKDDPILSLADTGLPGTFNTNLVVISEVGPEGNNGAIYTPGEGGPGAADFPVQYQIISDVPLPPSALLLGSGLLGLLGLRRFRKH